MKNLTVGNSHWSLRRVQSHAHAQAHTQESLRVQFIARGKSKYFNFLFYFIYIFILYLNIFISRKENVPKRGVHFAWKVILF